VTEDLGKHHCPELHADTVVQIGVGDDQVGPVSETRRRQEALELENPD
jgi:hypothetical protein